MEVRLCQVETEQDQREPEPGLAAAWEWGVVKGEDVWVEPVLVPAAVACARIAARKCLIIAGRPATRLNVQIVVQS